MEMWVISSGIIGTQEFIPRLSNVLQLLLLLHKPGGGGGGGGGAQSVERATPGEEVLVAVAVRSLLVGSVSV